MIPSLTIDFDGGKSFVLIHLFHQIELDEPWEEVVVASHAITDNWVSPWLSRHSM